MLFSICFSDNAIEAIDEFAFLEGEFLLDFSVLRNHRLGRERTESFAKLSVSTFSVIPSVACCAPLSTGAAQLDPEARAVLFWLDLVLLMCDLLKVTALSFASL